jgi:hypothetical protein
VGRLGRSRPALGPQANMGCQQTDPLSRITPPGSKSLLDPLQLLQSSIYLPEFTKVQKKTLNFNLALRLLSFIYSDLLVLYIYDLDLELFCNFML